METVSVKDFRERLKKEKLVHVSGMGFQIRRAPLLLLADENEDLWALARRDQDALTGRIKDLIANPTLPRMKRVLLSGVVSPRLGFEDSDDAVCVDHLLAHHEIAVSLFIEIVNFSLEPPDNTKAG